MKESYKKKVFALILLTVIITLVFLLIGLTEKNIGFFLPRRLKKIGSILISSYCIGYSSVTFQTITNNKVLTPSVLGLDSLYLFIQTVIVFFFGSGTLSLMTGTTNFFLSIGFMLLSSVILFFLLFKKESKNIYFLVLAGMIVGGLFNGLANFMQVLLDPNEFLIVQGKMFASFSNINTELFWICFVLLIGVVLLTRKDYSTLDTVSLGSDLAINLGVSYRAVVLKTLLVTAVLVSISTALTGPITFLGILVASLSREMLKTYRHIWRVLGAVFLGAFSLIFGQFLVERVFHFNTPISVMLNFVGGIYFIYLMLKEAK